jgi:hypothetical protein
MLLSGTGCTVVDISECKRTCRVGISGINYPIIRKSLISIFYRIHVFAWDLALVSLARHNVAQLKTQVMQV